MTPATRAARLEGYGSIKQATRSQRTLLVPHGPYRFPDPETPFVRRFVPGDCLDEPARSAMLAWLETGERKADA